MARPAIVRGTYVAVLMGDGATPTEVFTPLCGLTTRSFTRQINTSDQFIADCADPEDVPIREVIATGKQADMSGEGRYNRSQRTIVDAAIGVIKNYRFQILEPGAPATAVDKGYYSGKFMLTNVQITGGDEDYVTASMTWVSHGAWTWTAAT